MNFNPVYIPVGVPTYHLETAQDQFERSCAMLRAVDPDFVCPDEMLLSSRVERLPAASLMWLKSCPPSPVVMWP